MDEDVELKPGLGADSAEEVARFIPQDLRELYDIYSYKHAAGILQSGCTPEFQEVLGALRQFRITTQLITAPGGNESEIPKVFSRLLRPLGWYETRIRGDLLLTLEIHGQEEVVQSQQIVRKGFLDGHKVDYVKNRVAFDLEWNSKDQTFDRDLYAFRAFSDCGLISAAILVTRGQGLNEVFEHLGQAVNADGSPVLKKNGQPRLVKEKYGASTTWIGKLLYRLNAGRHGGCPVLVAGITSRLISDWSTHERNPAHSSR